MNIKTLFVLATMFVASAFSQTQLIRIDNYQYENNVEKSIPSSVLSIISDLQFGKIVDSGSNSQGSNSNDFCSSDKYVGGLYAKLETCVPLKGVLTYFEVDGNGNINKTTYHDPECQKIINQYTINPNECFSGYSFDGSPSVYSVIDITDMEYPDNSIIGVQYGGVCHGNWKENLVSSYFILTDKCVTIKQGSFTATCNSTTITETVSLTPGYCSNDGQVYSFAISSFCVPQEKDGNFLTICNSN